MADHEKPQGPIAIESVPWTEWRQGVRFEIHYRCPAGVPHMKGRSCVRRPAY
jgi:hypothetical protein